MWHKSKPSPDIKLFTLFPQLPAELRTQIWELSIPEPRIIYLEQYRLPSSKAHNASVTGYPSRSRPPAILSACRESRHVAKKSYTKAFRSADMQAETWIDFKRDTLYLSCAFIRPDRKIYINFSFLGDLSQDTKKVSNLAIRGVWRPLAQLPWQMAFFAPMAHLLHAFCNLEVVTLVNDEHTDDEKADLVVAVEGSPYSSEKMHNEMGARDPDYENMLNYDEYLLRQVHHMLSSEVVFPWFVYRTFIPRRRKEGRLGLGRHC